jgi:hypothetical protein
VVSWTRWCVKEEKEERKIQKGLLISLLQIDKCRGGGSNKKP